MDSQYDIRMVNWKIKKPREDLSKNTINEREGEGKREPFTKLRFYMILKPPYNHLKNNCKIHCKRRIY